MKAVQRALSTCTKAEFDHLSGGADINVYMAAFYIAAEAAASQFSALGIINTSADFVLDCEPSKDGFFSRDNPADVAVLAFDSAVRDCPFLIRDTTNFHSEIKTTVRNILCGPLTTVCNIAAGVHEKSYPAARSRLHQITGCRGSW